MNIIKAINNKLPISSTKKKILNNIYWAVFGKVINILSGLLVGVLIARYLGPEQFGLMNYVISYVTIFNVLATFGFDNIEIRELSKADTSNTGKILGTALFLRLIFAVATLLTVIISVTIFETNDFTKWMIIIYAFSFIAGTLNVIKNYFTAIVLNEYVVKTEIFRTVVSALTKILLLWAKAPLEWFIVAVTIDFFIIASGYIISYKKKVGSFVNWIFDKQIARYQIKEAYPLVFSGAAILIYQKIDQLMIGNMIDNVSVGQYSVGAKLSEFLVFIPMIISQTLTPLLVRAKVNSKEDYVKKRQLFLDVIFWPTFFLCGLLFISAKPLILFLYGKEYLDAIPVFQIMVWKAVFSAMFTSSAQIIVIEKLQRYAVLRNVVGCLFNVILNLLLIPKIGIEGAALTSIITLCLTGYICHLFIKPYSFLFSLQSDSVLNGLRRLKNLSIETLKKSRNA